eukprot:CAMPEP_0171983310 /NCGR_PEP_ID=MMETSP0993-20121228/273233_1 /TAXON_ID=483369 /ORGANISM="non described non described, Strain CCMP2098" /LENGTH=182 /DNA_ID=CAMNT_0012636069 /DNA_START=1661 /DNA_END=2207 /DNA_ORIENTATION=-
MMRTRTRATEYEDATADGGIDGPSPPPVLQTEEAQKLPSSTSTRPVRPWGRRVVCPSAPLGPEKRGLLSTRTPLRWRYRRPIAAPGAADGGGSEIAQQCQHEGPCGRGKKASGLSQRSTWALKGPNCAHVPATRMAIRSRFAAFGRGSAVAPLSVPDGGGGGACGYVNRSGGGAGGDAGAGD